MGSEASSNSPVGRQHLEGIELPLVSTQWRRIVQYGFVAALARLWRSEGVT